MDKYYQPSPSNNDWLYTESEETEGGHYVCDPGSIMEPKESN